MSVGIAVEILAWAVASALWAWSVPAIVLGVDKWRTVKLSQFNDGTAVGLHEFQKTWILQKSGLLASLSAIVVGAGTSWFFLVAIVGRERAFELVGALGVFWALFVLVVPRLVFVQHRHDRVVRQNDSMEIRLGRHTVACPVGEIQVAKYRDGFVVHAGDTQQIRLSYWWIRRLSNSKSLLEWLNLRASEN